MRPFSLVLLAVLGMLPGSLLPVVVSGAHSSLGFSIAQSASLGGAAILWTAIGALAIALIGVPSRWTLWVAAGLVALILLDLGSMRVTGFMPLLAIRAVHGLVAGVLTGIAYAAIGREAAPDRLFGLLLALQFLLGGAGIAILPGLIAAHGMPWLFAVLAGAAALMLCLVPALASAAAAPPAAPGDGPFRQRLPSGMLVWGLVALFLIQAGHTAGSAFMLELGRAHDMALAKVQAIAGFGGMAGVIGAAGAAILGTRRGRRGPLIWATAAGALAVPALLLPWPAAFAFGAAIGSISWAGSIPYVLGGCAAFASERGGAVWLSFVAKLGLAAGPLLGALVVSGDGFGRAILLSGLLGLAGAALFLRIERGRPAAA